MSFGEMIFGEMITTKFYCMFILQFETEQPFKQKNEIFPQKNFSTRF